MAEIKIDDSSNNLKVEVSADDIIELVLEENPTTGFMWEVSEIDSSQLSLISSEYELHEEAGVGGGGKKKFRFKVNKKAEGHVEIENRQKWSNEVYKTFRFNYH